MLMQTERALRIWAEAYASDRLDSADRATFTIPRLLSRAQSDRFAAAVRWGVAEVPEACEPGARYWFSEIEHARVQAIAALDLPGVLENIRKDLLDKQSDSVGELVNASAWYSLMAQDSQAEMLWRRAARNYESTSLFGIKLLLPRKTRLWVKQFEAAGLALLDRCQECRSLVHAPAAFWTRMMPIVRKLDELAFSVNSEPGLSPLADTSGADAVPDKNSLRVMPEDVKSTVGSEQGEVEAEAYRVFSRRWDEVVTPETLLSRFSLQLPGLPDEMDANSRRIRREAQAFTRRLLSRRLLHWRFDRMEGRVDSRKLARLVTSPANIDIFKDEEPPTGPAFAVSFLVDLSASMNGRERRLTVLALDCAVRALEAAGLTTEVLGFTTIGFKENPVYDLWRQSGSPDDPGRLNGMRLIVFKSAQQNWFGRRKYLAMVLCQEVAGENIDGESIEWAYRRLLKVHAERRLLVVLCDGAPHDEATAVANASGYLDTNLHEVIDGINSTSAKIVAVGVKSDVHRFFSHAVHARSADEVGVQTISLLNDVLTSSFNATGAS